MRLLHSCYLCGSKARLIQLNNIHEVICTNCGLNLRGSTEDEVVEKWNAGRHRVEPYDAFKAVKKFCEWRIGCAYCPAKEVGCKDGLPFEWLPSSLED